MIKSQEHDGLFYVSQSVKQIYEGNAGRPTAEALAVYGNSTIAEYLAQVRSDQGLRSFLVFDQTDAFRVGLEIASKLDAEVLPALIPERSLTVPGEIDLVPRPHKLADLKIAGHLAHASRLKRMHSGS